MTTRRPKPPQNVWLIEQRKRRGWKPEDVAARLDVAVPTIRGWESGRGIGPDSLMRLEALFGVAAPGQAETGGDELAAAIREQADAIRALVEELRLSRAGQVEATAVAFRALGALGANRDQPGTQNGSEHEAPVGTGR